MRQVSAMALGKRNPAEVVPPYANYAHAVEAAPGTRTLFISSLNGFGRDGATMPTDFESQAELIWDHLGRILDSASMSVSDLVSLRFHLAEPREPWCAQACSSLDGSSRSWTWPLLDDGLVWSPCAAGSPTEKHEGPVLAHRAFVFVAGTGFEPVTFGL